MDEVRIAGQLGLIMDRPAAYLWALDGRVPAVKQPLDPRRGNVPDVTQFFATVIASALGALVAAAIGFRYAWARFRRERSFDRRLTWHEGAVRDLTQGAQNLFLAVGSARSPHNALDRQATWMVAGESLGRLLVLEAEAEIYATNDAHAAITQATSDIRLTAQAAIRMSSSPVTKAPAEGVQRESDPLHMYEIAAKLMLHAASRLARDARESLGLEHLDRDWRLYDDELQTHLDHLDKLRVGDSSTQSDTAEDTSP